MRKKIIPMDSELGSKFMMAMARIADLLLLNLFFLLTCLPVITIGAASTALYTVCFRFDTDRERGVIKSYFQAFRDNFKQGTVLWLVFLLCGTCACIDIFLFYVMPGMLRYLFIVFVILFILVLMVSSYAFPLLSQFANKTKDTLKNALILSLGYLPRTVVMVVLNCLPFALLLIDMYLFLQVGFIWVALYFSAAAYLNSILLKKVFAPYMQTEDEIKEEI